MQGTLRNFSLEKLDVFSHFFFRMNKLAFMIFVGEIRRAVRSPPLINSKFHMGFIPEHRTKTPRTEKKKEKENLVPADPLHQRAQGFHKPFREGRAKEDSTAQDSTSR